MNEMLNKKLQNVTLNWPICYKNTDKLSGKSGAETFANMVRDLEDQLNIEHHFSEIVEKQTYTDMIDTIKQTAVEDPCSLVNPRKITQSDVENILNNLM